MPANYNSGPAPAKAPAPRIALPPILPAPARNVSAARSVGAAVSKAGGKGPVFVAPAPRARALTPTQNAASSIGAARASQRYIQQRILPGPGLTSRQAAAENLGRAKAQQLIARDNAPIIETPTTPHLSTGPGYGAQLAAIRVPGGWAGPVDHVVGSAFKDAIDLPIQLGVGAEAVGKAAVTGDTGTLLKMAKGIVTTNPFYEAATGNWKALGDQAYNHPLDFGLNAVGTVGAAGRLAGTAGRLAGADWANTARVPGEIGSTGVTREGYGAAHYSKNAIMQTAQKYAESNPRLTAFNDWRHTLGKDTYAATRKQVSNEVAAAQHVLRTRVNKFHAGVKQDARNLMAEHAHTMAVDREAVGLPTANIASHGVIGRLPPGREGEALQRIHDNLVAAEDAHYNAVNRINDPNWMQHSSPMERQAAIDARMTDHALSHNEAQQRMIEDYTANPNHEALRAIIDKTTNDSNSLDSLLAAHGVYPATQLERRPLLAYAHDNMEGVRYGTATDHTPEWHAHQDSRKDLVTATRNVPKSVKAHDALKGKRTQADAEWTRQQRALVKAQITQSRTRGFVEGRQGADFTQPNYEPRPLKITQSTVGRYVGHNVALEQAAQHAAQALGHAKATRLALRAQAEQDVRGAKDALKDARATHAANRQALKDAGGNYDRQHVIADPQTGVIRPVLDHEIKSHMAANGIDHVAYVSHRLTPEEEKAAALQGHGQSGTLSRGDSPSKPFTARGLRQGAWDASHEGLMRSRLASVAHLVHAVAHDRFIHAFRADPGEYTKDEFKTFAREHKANTGMDVLPMYSHAKQMSEDAVKNLHLTQDSGKGDSELQQAIFKSRIANPDYIKPDERVVPVYKTAVEQWQHHLKVDGIHGPTQEIIRHFRNTVLPFSTKWLMGNVAEAAIRNMVAGVRPGDTAFRNKALANMPDRLEAAQQGNLSRQEFDAHTVGEGLHFGMADRANQGALVAHNGEEAAALQSAVVKNARSIKYQYKRLIGGIFHVNSKLERQFEKAAQGHWMRQDFKEFQQTMGKSVDAQQAYFDAIKNGRMDMGKAREASDYIHRTLGQYNQFSPEMKKVIKTWAPFSPWYLNSVKFVYHTMPVGHPLATAALAAVNNSTPGYVNPDYKTVPGTTVDGLPFGSLTSAVKAGPQAYTDLLRFTPAGAFTNDSFAGLGSAVLPQVEGPLMALGGMDPFGRQLKGPNGVGKDGLTRMSVAASEVLSSIFGPVNFGERAALSGGRTPYNTSTLWDPQYKPGTATTGGGVPGGIWRAIDPLRATYLNPKASGANIHFNLPPAHSGAFIPGDSNPSTASGYTTHTGAYIPGG